MNEINLNIKFVSYFLYYKDTDYRNNPTFSMLNNNETEEDDEDDDEKEDIIYGF